MRVRMLPSLAAHCLPLLLLACGGGAAIGGGDAVMRYAVPEGTPLTYERTDTMAVSIEAPGVGSFTVHIDQAMTLGVGFAPSANGVRVTTTVERLSARMTNPLAQPAALSESDIVGDLLFSVDGRGNVHVLELPEVSGAGGPLFNATSLVYELLPKLPPLGVVPGGSWVDTISYAAEDATGRLEVTRVGTSTFMGDTVADGRRLSLVRTEAEVTIEVTTAVGGMNVNQSMSGLETGFYLWDPSRRALVEQVIERNLEGTVKVAAVPSPMDLTAKQRRTMRLVGGE